MFRRAAPAGQIIPATGRGAARDRVQLAIIAHRTGLTVPGALPGRRLPAPEAGLNALTIITGFAVFHAVHTTLGFDRRLVFAGYRQATLIAPGGPRRSGNGPYAGPGAAAYRCMS